MTKNRGTEADKGSQSNYKKGLHDHAVNEKVLLLLIVSPLTGSLYVLAFPMIAIVTATIAAWTKRKVKQIYLERKHSKVVAFLISFVNGLLYVAVFPLIIMAALIKKLALDALEKREKNYRE